MKDCVFRGFSIVPFRHLFCLCPQAVEFTGKMLEHSAYRAAHGAAWFGMRRAWLYAAPFFSMAVSNFRHHISSASEDFEG